MLLAPINQRYANVEDIFTYFIAPVILNYVTGTNDAYYLYTPYKNACPTKALIKKGITVHYTPYHIHQAFILAYNDLEKQIWENLYNYFNYNSTNTPLYNRIYPGSPENPADPDPTVAFKEINNDEYTKSKLDSLRLFILNAFTYINTNVIAELSVFYDHIITIKQPDFTIDESKYGTDSTVTLSIGFKKLSDLTQRISQHIPDINKFSIADFINVYLECVIKENFDVIYTLYKIKGFTVIDNSETHLETSLCRLCDIVQIGIFEISNIDGYSDNIYDYDQYAAFNDTDDSFVYPDLPYCFKLLSYYTSNHYSIPFQISDILVSAMGTTGIEYKSTLTDEAIATYTSMTYNNNTGVLSNDLTAASNKIVNDASSVLGKSRAASIESTVKQPTLTLDPSLFDTKYTAGSINQSTLSNFTGNFKSTIDITALSGLNLKDPTTLSSYKENITDITSLKYANTSLMIKNIGVGLIPYVDNNYVPSYCIARSNIDPDKYTQYAACFVTPNLYPNKRTAIISLTLNESLINEDVIITQWGSPLKITLSLPAPIYKHNLKINNIETDIFDKAIRWRFKLRQTAEPLIESDEFINFANYSKEYNSFLGSIQEKVDAYVHATDGNYTPNPLFFDFNNDNQLVYDKVNTEAESHYTYLILNDLIVNGYPTGYLKNYHTLNDTMFPEVNFFFLTDDKYIGYSNQTLEEQFYIKCTKATHSEISFNVYFNSYSVSVPELLKRIMILYQYDAVPVYKTAGYVTGSESTKLAEDFEKYTTTVVNLLNDTKGALFKDGGNIVTISIPTDTLKYPIVKLQWEYNSNNITYSGKQYINNRYTTLYNSDDGIEVLENSYIDNWVKDKNYNGEYPDISLTAWDTNNINLNILSLRDSSIWSL